MCGNVNIIIINFGTLPTRLSHAVNTTSEGIEKFPCTNKTGKLSMVIHKFLILYLLEAKNQSILAQNDMLHLSVC